MPDPRCPDGCGKCCDPVVSPHTLDDLRRLLPFQVENEEDRAFMLTHLTPLSRSEGLRRAPYLSNGGRSHMLVRDELTQRVHEMESWSNFYECVRFDRETKRCTDYANRPPMCRDYPMYGDTIDSDTHAAKALPDGCVYLPEPVRKR